MAEIIDFTLEINGIEKTIKSVDDLEQSIKDLQNTIKLNQGRGVLDNTELEKNLTRLEKLRLETKATRDVIKQTSIDGARSMGTLREAFDGAGAAAEILSGENEKVGRVVMTVMKSIGVANSVREVSENKSTIAIIANRVATQANIATQKIYDATLKGTIVSLRTFRIVLAGLGIGVAMVAIGKLAEVIYNYTTRTEEATKKQKEFNRALDETPGTVEYYERKLKSLGATEADIARDRIKRFTTDRNNIQALLDDAIKKEGERNNTYQNGARNEIDILNTKIREQEIIITNFNQKQVKDEKTKSDEIVDINSERFNQQSSLMNQYYEEQQLLILQSAESETEKENLLLRLEIKRMEDELLLRRKFFQQTTDLEIRLYNAKKNLLNKEKEDSEKAQQDRQEKLKKYADMALQNFRNERDAQKKTLEMNSNEELRLLVNNAKAGEDISRKKTELEIKRLEELKKIYFIFGEEYKGQMIETELQIAEKKKQIRDEDREQLFANINAGLNLLTTSLQASMDLENVRRDNLLNNARLTEEEREKIAKDSFEKQKKLQLQMAYVDAAKGITSIIAQYPKFDGGIAMYLALATTAVMNGAAIARIKRTQYQSTSGLLGDEAQPTKFARGGLLVGPLHSQGGIRTSFGELEGGEFVVNRNSTRMYGSLISAINQAGGGRKFADGGILGLEDQLKNLQKSITTPVVKAYVLEGDISNAMEAEQKIKYRTTL